MLSSSSSPPDVVERKGGRRVHCAPAAPNAKAGPAHPFIKKDLNWISNMIKKS